MLKKIEGKINYPKKFKKYVRRLQPWDGEKWTITDGNMKMLKKHIKSYLSHIQNDKCAYCGLRLNETSGGEIEHIAPKGGKKQPINPQFTFTPYNLVLACHLCNSPVKKGKINTISNLNINYKLCNFTIVHPYFDNPSDYFEWITNGNYILISSDKVKGKKSIEMFKLDSPAHNEARAKQALYENIGKFDIQVELLLQEILNYK